ncbi:MAG TPA: hypothetical protein VGD56_10510 [Gemmatirosa sp.]
MQYLQAARRPGSGRRRVTFPFASFLVLLFVVRPLVPAPVGVGCPVVLIVPVTPGARV